MKIAAGEKVRPIFWDAKTQRLRLDRRHPEHTDINLRLNQLELTINQIYRDSNNGDISTADFRKEIEYRLGYAPRPESLTIKSPAFFAFIQTFLEEKKAQPRGTWKILQTVFTLLKSYADERTGGSAGIRKC